MLLEAGYSRFAYGYARFGMAAPDGLMDLIPVTEQTGIYGRPNFSYRGVFDPLDFGFNDNDALNSSWRAAVSYVTGAHNMKVGYRARSPRCTTGACRTTRSCGTRSTNARTRARRRQSPVPACRTSCRRAGISTIAPRRCRAVRAGPVDDRPADAAGRRAVRPRVELGAGRGQRHDAARRASTRSRSRSSGRSASAATTTSRRASGSPTTCSATARRRSR